MRLSRRFGCAAILAVCLLSGKSAFANGQEAPGAGSKDLNAGLAAIEKTIDAKRQDLHIPGASLVIVKDDKVIFLKGFGLRDIVNKLPVTPETQFAIGSSTKAFTAMTVMMSVDDGKMDLAASPKRYLSYFKMKDPEADSKITIGDLLCHRSGLDRTDLIWYTNKLNSEETIRLIGQIKPTAKFGEKFQYQNVMFLVAGQCVAAVQKTQWRKVVSNRILKPLGMKATNTTIRELSKSRDHALGYTYDAEQKVQVLVPYHDLPVIAPAGAINSNAKEMAQWLRFMLGGGVFEGKRLVSEGSFAELFKKRMTVAGPVGYGYGWFLRDWNGHRIVEHGGNIDGFNAEVAMMPDQKLGFVLLTNVSASPLGAIAMDTVWQNLVSAPKAAEPADAALAARVPADQEAGTYRLQDVSVDIVVATRNGKLTARATTLPESPLENLSGRRYKVVVPGVDGIFITFRPTKSDTRQTEILLEQPGVKFVGKRVVGSEDAGYSGPQKELIGKFHSAKVPTPFAVSVRNGKVAFIVPGQPAYPLNPKSAKDEYSLGGLPSDFALIVHRDKAGKVTGALLKQPAAQGDLELSCEVSGFVAPMTVDELMQRVVEAGGGDANMRRHKSLTLKLASAAETQGITLQQTIYLRSPNSAANLQKMYAGRKQIAVVRSYFDGKTGGSDSTLGGSKPAQGDSLDELANGSAMFPELNWRSLFKSASITGKEKVGDEEALVVELVPKKGKTVTDYISAKTFHVLRRKTGSGGESETYEDYRPVDGVQIPFRRVENLPGLGEVITTVTSAKFDARIPDSVFQAERRE